MSAVSFRAGRPDSGPGLVPPLSPDLSQSLRLADKAAARQGTRALIICGEAGAHGCGQCRDVADRQVADALARSFLAELPPGLIDALRADGERADYPAGTTVYQAWPDPKAALVVRGLMRVHLSSPGAGRSLSAMPGPVMSWGSP
jgi:hypothetical protein